MESIIPNWKARVWNDGDRPYTEEFRGEKLTIPAHGYIEMDYYDGIMFRGQYIPAIKNEVGQWITEKRIRVEKLDETRKDVSQGFVNPFNGKTFTTKEELDADIASNRDKVTVLKDEKAVSPQPSSDVGELKDMLKTVVQTMTGMSERITKLEGTSKPKRAVRKGGSGDTDRDNRRSEASD